MSDKEKFDDLVRDCTGIAFDGLIKEGTTGLRSSMYVIYNVMIGWYLEQAAEKDKKAKRKQR